MLTIFRPSANPPSLFASVAVPPGATFGVVDGRELYRYDLLRSWDSGGLINLLMLNPSTADENNPDPTITRCLGFARSWGFGSLAVTNLFAYRATQPADMKAAADPVGPDNDAFILKWARRAELVVCAWGTGGEHLGRGAEVLDMLRTAGIEPHCLRLTKGGHPEHPLYIPAATRAVPIRKAG